MVVEPNVWINAVSLVGFPIVAFFFIAHKYDKLAKVIENNTAVLNEIKGTMNNCKKS